jgi:enoyl-CoA hydratase/carnithine racemase
MKEQPQEFVTLERYDHLAIVRLNRPPVNAISKLLAEQLAQVVAAIDADPSIYCTVLSGGPRMFSAGVDIKDLEKAPPEDAIPRNRRFLDIYGLFERMKAPVLAAINGYVVGGAVELVLACDVRVLASDAFIAVPEVRLGGLPHMQRLNRMIPLGKLRRWVYTSERLTAAQSLELGIVDELAPPGAAEDAALELATKIASQPPLTIQAAKQAITIGRQLPFAEAEEYELKLVGKVASTKDRFESLHAFVEKRAAQLQGL